MLLDFFISQSFAEETAVATTGAGASGGFTSFIPLILIFGIMYFLLIRPQMKKNKAHKELLSQIGLGDEVATFSGINGKITALSDFSVKLLVAKDTEIQFDRVSIARILPKGTLDGTTEAKPVVKAAKKPTAKKTAPKKATGSTKTTDATTKDEV